MNNKIVTLGVAALGVAALGVAAAQAADAGKIWEVTASLRGFYDDNYTTSPEALAEESWGIEVSPGISLTIGEGTDMELSARYGFGMRYYEDRESDNEDYGHELGIGLDKMFSNSSRLQLSNALVVAQEPEILNGGTPLRTEGDNLRNTLSARYRQVVKSNFGFEVAESYSIFDFESARYSSLLDRDYNVGNIDLFWSGTKTEFLVGYQFSRTKYDGDDIGEFFIPQSRNNYAHYTYLGAHHQLNKSFAADVRAGWQYVDFYDFDKDPNGSIPEDENSPFVDARVEWSYAGGTLTAGVNLARGATDLQAADQETASEYVQLVHKISAKVHGTLTARYQNSEISGGYANGMEEDLLLLGASLTYAVSDNVWAEVAYNYDELDSDVRNPRTGNDDRSFERNYVSVSIGTSF